MASAINDWLAPFLAKEVEDAIAWGNTQQSDLRSAGQSNQRFRDDGSSFRCEVGSPPLTGASQVQLREIMFIMDDGYNDVVISDGWTEVRASFSKSALDTLAAELDEPFGLDTQGDVFTIRECWVISTPNGPPEDFVRIQLESIEYQAHFRKLKGNPVPIQKHRLMLPLLDDLNLLRHRQFATDGSDQAEDSPINREPTQGLTCQLSPSPGSTGVDATTQEAFATQITTSRRKQRSAPKRDGGDSMPKSTADRTGSDSSETNARKRKHLLHLMLKGKHETAPTEDDGGEKVETRPSTPSESSLQMGEGIAGPPVADVSRKHADDNSPSTREHNLGDDEGGQQALLEPSPNKSQTFSAQDPAVKLARTYGRLKISKDQQNILANPSSWRPAPVGRSFPVANMPVAALVELKQIATKHLAGGQTNEALHKRSMTDKPVEFDDPQGQSTSLPENDSPLEWSSSPPLAPVDDLPPDSSFARAATTKLSIPPSPSASIAQATVRGPRPAPSAPMPGDSSPLIPVWEAQPPPPRDAKGNPEESASPASELASTPRPVSFSQNSYVVPQSEERGSMSRFQGRDLSSQHRIRGPPLLSASHEEDQNMAQGREIDPNIKHRQQRSETFGRAQRKKWLLENHTIDQHREDPDYDLVAAYLNEFPHDRSGAEAIKQEVALAFPRLCEGDRFLCEWTLRPKKRHLSPQGRGSTTPLEPESKRSRFNHRVATRYDTLPLTDTIFNEFARAFRNTDAEGYLHQNGEGGRRKQDVPYETDALQWHFHDWG